jgi:Universal stress protein family
MMEEVPIPFLAVASSRDVNGGWPYGGRSVRRGGCPSTRGRGVSGLRRRAARFLPADANDLALNLAAPAGARVVLLHVIETLRDLELDEGKPFYQKLEQKAQRIMTAATHRLPKTHAEVVQEIVYGDRAEEIVKFAAAHQTDLIVLASHRVTPSATNRDWGTISYKVGMCCS